MSLKKLVEAAYQKVTGCNRGKVIYVNRGKKYISVKIDEPHLTTGQIEELKKIISADATYGSRLLRVINSYSEQRNWLNSSEPFKTEKVLVRFAKEIN